MCITVTCNATNGDDPACGTAPFTNDSCDTNPDTMFHCPYMCYVCPCEFLLNITCNLLFKGNNNKQWKTNVINYR